MVISGGMRNPTCMPAEQATEHLPTQTLAEPSVSLLDMGGNVSEFRIGLGGWKHTSSDAHNFARSWQVDPVLGPSWTNGTQPESLNNGVQPTCMPTRTFYVCMWGCLAP